MRRKITPTISDVASHASVSKASVSRYLNGNFSALSDDLKKKIKKAILELNYKPNQMARSLKRGNSKLIAYLLPDITNNYSIEVMKGIEKACQDHGYTMMICNTDESRQREDYYLEILNTYNVEGVIFQAQGKNSHVPLDNNFPIVLLDRYIEGFEADFIGIDNQKATSEAMEYLIYSGFEAFLFITGNYQDISSRKSRVTEFKIMLAKQQHTIGEVAELKSTQDNERGLELITILQKFSEKYRGMRKVILTINGSTALQTSLAMKSLGLIWGRDIALLTFDDPAWASVIGDGITAIKQPTYDLGYLAFMKLLKRINGSNDSFQSTMLNSLLVVRGSTQ